MTVEFHGNDAFGFDMNQAVEECMHLMSSLGFVGIDFYWPHRLDVLFINTRWHDVGWLREVAWKVKYSYMAAARRKLKRIAMKRA